MTEDLSRPEQIVALASQAIRMEEQPADAAALLVEAAAMNALECGLPLEDLVAWLCGAHATLDAAKRSVEAHPGNLATFVQ